MLRSILTTFLLFSLLAAPVGAATGPAGAAMGPVGAVTAPAGSATAPAGAVTAPAGAATAPLIPGLSALTRARHLLPEWITWENRQIRFDLNRDSRYDLLTLKNGQVRVYSEENVLYETPDGWLIADAHVTDLDGDGSQEMLFLTWKADSFGSSMPFWMKRDRIKLTEHLFVLEWTETGVRQKWMSSSLGEQIFRMWIDKNGYVRLEETDGSNTTWAWDYFGFALVEEILPAAAKGKSEEATASIQEGSSVVEPLLSKDETMSFTPYSSGSTHTPDTLTLLAVGDNLMHQSIYEGAYVPARGVFDFTPLYENVKARISSNDLAVVNQETILVHDPAHRSGYPEFATPESVGDALIDAGFDIVLAATNHVNDRGQKAIADTLAFWEKHPEICLLGLHASEEEASQIPIIERNGVRLALFNYTYGLNGHALPSDKTWQVDLLSNEEKLLLDLQAAEASSDLSVCFFHMGEEYALAPSEEDFALWERCTDAGADVIICSHPHVVWPVMSLVTLAGNKSIVCESLGNFAANMDKWRTSLGAAAGFTLCKDGVISCHLSPLICHFANRKTTVYFLEDYTEELALKHALSVQGDPASLEDLWQLWEEETMSPLSDSLE